MYISKKSERIFLIFSWLIFALGALALAYSVYTFVVERSSESHKVTIYDTRTSDIYWQKEGNAYILTTNAPKTIIVHYKNEEGKRLTYTAIGDYFAVTVEELP